MGRSADTSQGPPASHKTTRPAFSLPTQAGAHHTSCAHRRLPLPLPPFPSSWPSSPSPADSQERAGLHERWRKCGYELGRSWRRCWTGVPPNLRVCESGVCPTGSGGACGRPLRADVPCHAGCTARGYRCRRDVLGGVVARARRRVPRHHQGGLPCKSCWSLKNALGIELTSERGHQS